MAEQIFKRPSPPREPQGLYRRRVNELLRRGQGAGAPLALHLFRYSGRQVPLGKALVKAFEQSAFLLPDTLMNSLCRHKGVFAATALLWMIGCGPSKPISSFEDRVSLAETLQPGAAKQDVIKMLGEPNEVSTKPEKET